MIMMEEARPTAPAWSAVLRAGQTLPSAGVRGALWRVLQGWLAQYDLQEGGARLVQLAGPGDLGGLADLSGCPHREAAVALTPVRAEMHIWDEGSDQSALMHTLVAQQQRQARDMACLRTGSVPERVRHLLAMWAPAETALDRATLPRLRDMARIMDVTPETVCRELGRQAPRARATVRRPAPKAAMALTMACAV